MGKSAEAPPAAPARRRTPDRVVGRTPAIGSAAQPAAAAPADTPGTDAMFYDKGAATAASFRPSYWSYEHAPSDAARQSVGAAGAAEEAQHAIAPAPAEPTEQDMSQDSTEDRRELRAVVGGPLDSASVADELAATIEHVLGSRYGGARPAAESAPTPRLMASAVTADSLMAELAAARQSRSPGDERRAAPQTSRAPKKAKSLVDRAFALGGIALILFVLLALSPWRDSFLSPAITRFFG